ncbi:tRNA (cytidine(34)-2'-O)-methyltransferase [Sulfuricurvum sp. IAE1]|jgi:tRNA (cytidine/uridine-2'-O-)-methyltransferase|uniref:tRNA (cytidine(34)-2'-O)-methyltransferase n=1 Tax=Sulfuricurvum sp. IAE1 TaxID=2546102 RepID=UPI00105240E9|nr:tRNA (cytidine(34)-2'-O)-methyltransferase [Sulfuricurvum sp. IAE1]MDD3769975.1 tRNA (cytidine(34)-2'-O)-methyltransferase [Sulfuricurvum sp.]MDX9965653.1 tRNA (cytidine(34)-2'-O)-methyltransferase [Sulfuricurvum sp.]TDA63138.1 tRNA (cytidine(34)-2'-O)-methyltransferase [Sulfuricurvum sp. IAE1]
MFNIVLVTPQIPNNTGAIGRLCVNTASTLHLVKPLGFDIGEKALRRAGMDYWHKLDLQVWESLDDFLEAHPNRERFFLATTKTDRPYFDIQFRQGDYLIFGSETSGLPAKMLESFGEQTLTIPMAKEGRSLNLAISTGIILYEAIKQNFDAYKELM